MDFLVWMRTKNVSSLLGDIGFYECTVLPKLTTTLASGTAMSYFGWQSPQTAVTVKCEEEVPEEEDKPSLVTGKGYMSRKFERTCKQKLKKLEKFK